MTVSHQWEARRRGIAYFPIYLDVELHALVTVNVITTSWKLVRYCKQWEIVLILARSFNPGESGCNTDIR